MHMVLRHCLSTSRRRSFMTASSKAQHILIPKLQALSLLITSKYKKSTSKTINLPNRYEQEHEEKKHDNSMNVYNRAISRLEVPKPCVPEDSERRNKYTFKFLALIHKGSDQAIINHRTTFIDFFNLKSDE